MIVTRQSYGRTARSLILRALLIVIGIVSAGAAWAAEWSPPPLNGHVVDQAGALTAAESRALDQKLERARLEKGFAIVVYLLPQLPNGLSIEDVGYRAGNTWKVGDKGTDDGVILIASLGDRKLRIETGKGVGGALTDIQSSHINREVIGPLLREGRTYDAMDRGVDAILSELVANTEGGRSGTRDPTQARRSRRSAQPEEVEPIKVIAIAIAIVVVIILAIVSPTFRQILFWILLFGRFGGGGGGGRGGSGGSGYGGGGGSFGGGGSSDDY